MQQIIGHGKIRKQDGGRGQFAKVTINLIPKDNTENPEIIDKTVGGVIPKQYIEAVKRGCLKACENGPLEGWPVIGLDISIVDGESHPVDSSDIAFEEAGFSAVKDAFSSAEFNLLEPIAKAEIRTSLNTMGDVMSLLSRNRAIVTNTDVQDEFVIINTEIPIKEVLGITSDLRNISKGRSTCSYTPFTWRAVPDTKER